MDDRNAQVGWTEAQWNRVREEVLQAWQRVRVATRAVPPSNLSLLGLVRHMSDTERGWVRQAYRG